MMLMIVERQKIPLFVFSSHFISIYNKDDSQQIMCAFDNGDRGFMTNTKCMTNEWPERNLLTLAGSPTTSYLRLNLA